MNEDLVGMQFTDSEGRTLIVTGPAWDGEQYMLCETEDKSYRTARNVGLLRAHRQREEGGSTDV